jgi:hypothetical protein
MGSRWRCLGGRLLAIIGALRKGSMGSDLVVEFHTQFYKFVEILSLIGLVNKTSLEFLGEPSFESGLLRLGGVIQNSH